MGFIIYTPVAKPLKLSPSTTYVSLLFSFPYPILGGVDAMSFSSIHLYQTPTTYVYLKEVILLTTNNLFFQK